MQGMFLIAIILCLYMATIALEEESSVAIVTENFEVVNVGDFEATTLPFLNTIDSQLQLHSEEDLVNTNSNIPPIFIMNLDRAPQRWEKISEEVTKAGINSFVRRFPAVDGKKLSIQELRAETTALSRFFQPRGVIGCYLSHRRFWQMVVDKSLPMAIILEDDVTLVEGFKEKLASNLKALNTSDPFDIIFLGAIGRVHPEDKGGLGPKIFTLYTGGARPLRRISDTLYQPVRPAGTHGYLVSLEGAKKLLNLCPKATFHVDLDAWRHPSLILRIFQPMLVYQTFDDTSLTDAVSATDKIENILQSNATWKSVQKSVQKIKSWTKDETTLQPWSHVLAEPLMQLGPQGWVLTVERHLMVATAACAMAAYFDMIGRVLWAKIAFGSAVVFSATVRLIIWLLMNWR